MNLSDLVGEHILTGVDFDNMEVEHYGAMESVQVMHFVLDDITYTVLEDPSDGYRSSMEEIKVSEASVDNIFDPVHVIGRIRERGECGCCDVLELIDVQTGKIVLEAGTENTDDYYPWFVVNFTPENMAINQGKEANS